MSDNSTLFSYIQKTIEEISLPLNVILGAITDDPTLQRIKETIKDGDSLVRLECNLLLINLSKADYNVSYDEVKLFQEFRDEFGRTSDGFGFTGLESLSYYREFLSRWDYDENQSMPVTVKLLKDYDAIIGTDYAEKAKAMFFRLATATAKADDNVSVEETRFLENYHNILYGHSSINISEQAKHSLSSVSPSQPKECKSVDDLISELNNLIGLDSVKNDVLQLVNFLKVQKMRQSKGMITVPISRHLVFYGNPGTGKTTVARLLAKIYKSLEIISKGHLIETDRSGLVAGYVGQTAIKVKEVVTSAIGGVLFIDEAYALAGERDDYGQEAIDTLIKLMEDNRDDLIVVVAGYPEKMGRFLSTNPGLKSRFNKYFNFEDYSPSQLSEIFQMFCNSSGFRTTERAAGRVSDIFQILHDVRDETFGNARLARNVFERAVNNQANRLIRLSTITDDTLSLIEEIDIPGAVDFHPTNTI